MKTLIEAVEAWIDERVFANSWTTDHEPKFEELNAKVNKMEEIHIRDANRIAELERRVMSLDEDNSFDKSEANIIDITERLEDIESRLESVEGEVDIEEIAQNVHDNVERFIIDAVRTEIDAIDFKVTVER